MLLLTIAFEISLKIRRPTKQARARQRQRVMRLIFVRMRRQSHQHLRFSHRRDLEILTRQTHFSPMSVALLTTATMLFAFAQCRILSGTMFVPGTKVDVNCHGDAVEFDGNLRIRQLSTGRVVFNSSTPVDPTARLAFQTDGACLCFCGPLPLMN